MCEEVGYNDTSRNMGRQLASKSVLNDFTDDALTDGYILLDGERAASPSPWVDLKQAK